MSGLNWAINKAVAGVKRDGITRFAYATRTTLVTTEKRPGTEVPRYFAAQTDGVYEVTTEYGPNGAARSARKIADLDGRKVGAA